MSSLRILNGRLYYCYYYYYKIEDHYHIYPFKSHLLLNSNTLSPNKINKANRLKPDYVSLIVDPFEHKFEIRKMEMHEVNKKMYEGILGKSQYK